MEQTPSHHETGSPLLSWSAPSHPRHNRTMGWYLIFFLVILTLAAYGAYTNNWTFSILLLLCGLLYPLLHDHLPSEKHIELYSQGLLFEGSSIRWEDCTGFWILPFQNYTELHIEFFEGKRQKTVKIQTGNLDTTTLRLQLVEFLPELSDRGERILDMIIRICKL